MKKIIGKFKNFLNRIKKRIEALRVDLRNSYWYAFSYKRKIDENMIFVESRDGLDFTGNIFRIVEELAKDEYSNFKVYVLARKNVAARIERLKSKYNLGKLRIIKSVSDAIPVMERAKYIVSDSGIPWEYVKREGQVVINTWHGTPFKFMGRKIETEKHAIGTVQHFFFSTDFFMYPSRYMMETMQKDYMVKDLVKGKAVLSGYPRNSIFFKKEKAATVRHELGLDGKQVIAYMPTHRINNNKNSKQLDDVLRYLTELDAWLEDSQTLLVKLHVLNQSKIDFTQFQRIIPFPEEYETYDVLNTVDCLITDYSSVFFDFANTRNKIILFTYDEDEYLKDRGTYFPLSELPFPSVKTVEELLKEINSPKNYDDEKFVEKYCPYDSFDATTRFCKHVFRGEKVCSEERFGNEKENVLIMGGSLAKNGITTALVNLLNNLDVYKRNYFVTFWRTEIDRGGRDRIDVIPEKINYVPIMCDPYFTLAEKIAFRKFSKSKDLDTPYPNRLHIAFKRELDRYFWGADFSHAIQFDGYGKMATMLFAEIKANRTIFVHNDMVRELKTRNIQHGPTLKWAYNLFEHVAMVSGDLYEPTVTISGRPENIIVVNNTENPNSIRERSMEQIIFEKDTDCVTSNPNGILGVLNSDDIKIITIGRFSAEKGHWRIIKAFDKFCESYPNAQLIIIGGHGILYNNTLNWRKESKNWNRITIIKSIRNPMPILKRCNLFVLPSLYEGLPMTIKEADILGIPVISTNIRGPRGFLSAYGGYLCEESVDSILQALFDFMEGHVPVMNIDYCKYNEQAIAEFEVLLKEEVK